MSQGSAGTFAGDIAQSERITAFLSKVYGWMFVGLALTAAVAFYVASTPALVEALVVNRWPYYGLMFGTLGLVWWLSARASTMAPATAASLFALYAALPFPSSCWCTPVARSPRRSSPPPRCSELWPCLAP
jgi:FtsH-binding integral membrane protein